MPAGDAPQTLTELRTDILERLRQITGVAATNTIVDRYINTAVFDMHLDRGHLFPWSVRRDVIQTHPDYSTGTITLNRNATAVTGASTTWATANAWGQNNARVGGKLRAGSNNEVYNVTAVGTDTSLTIGSIFTGSADLSAAGYLYFEDEYALASNFLRPVNLRVFSEAREIRLIGPQEFYLRYPRNDVVGKPKYATIIELGPSGNTTARPRVIFGPAPTDAETIPYRYVTNQLWVSSAGTAKTYADTTTDEPIIYPMYRQAIVWFALWHWWRDRRDDERARDAKAAYDEFMLRMTGSLLGAEQDRPRLVPWQVPSVVTGRFLRRRFDVNNLFDQMRWP